MLGHQITIQASRSPHSPAVAFGERRLDYRMLEERAARLAQALVARGLRRGDRVAVLLANCPHFFELLFATTRLGLIFVPVNFRLAPPEVARVVLACRPSLLFAGQGHDAALTAITGIDHPPEVMRINDEIEPGPADAPYEDWLAAHPPMPGDTGLDRRITADEPAMLMHSSGTTGLPKAAIHTHGTALASSMAKTIDFGLSPADRAVVFGPLFHAGPLMDLALPLLLRGGSVVLGASRNFDAGTMMQTIARERGTVAPVYPTMLRRMMASDIDAHDLSSLRLIISGGEPLTTDLLSRVQQKLPHTEVLNNYGSTEGGPITTFLPRSDAARKPGSVGRPAYGMELRIAGDDGQALPDGEVGEIQVRGPFTCHGYWQRPDLTAAAMCASWWRTGDQGRRDGEGFVWITGRIKDMIKTGTENVYPIEVEDVIASVPGVAEVAVVGVPDPDFGEAVVACVVPLAGVPPSVDAILAACRRDLAGYKKPRQVHFVSALPRTTVNKIDREALRLKLTAER